MNETIKKEHGLANKEIIMDIKKESKFLKALPWISIIILIVGLYIAFYFGNITIAIDANALIITIVFSILINIVLLITAFVLPIGRKVILRFRQKLMYKTGKFVNALFITKNGILKEVFKQKSDRGTVVIEKDHYTRNPTLLFNYEGIPTYLYIEGHADPLNVWSDKYAAVMSCSEIDEVMNGSGAFDLRQWLEQNKMILLIALLIMIGATVVAAYFGLMSYNMLRDGTYAAIKGAVQLKSGV